MEAEELHRSLAGHDVERRVDPPGLRDRGGQGRLSEGARHRVGGACGARRRCRAPPEARTDPAASAPAYRGVRRRATGGRDLRARRRDCCRHVQRSTCSRITRPRHRRCCGRARDWSPTTPPSFTTSRSVISTSTKWIQRTRLLERVLALAPGNGAALHVAVRNCGPGRERRTTSTSSAGSWLGHAAEPGRGAGQFRAGERAGRRGRVRGVLRGAATGECAEAERPDIRRQRRRARHAERHGALHEGRTVRHRERGRIARPDLRHRDAADRDDARRADSRQPFRGDVDRRGDRFSDGDGGACEARLRSSPGRRIRISSRLHWRWISRSSAGTTSGRCGRWPTVASTPSTSCRSTSAIAD